MYKNMYDPKSKISLLLLSSIATILAEIQGKNKKNKNVREVKKSEAKRKTRKWLNFILFSKF
jgi:hypothetical protein